MKVALLVPAQMHCGPRDVAPRSRSAGAAAILALACLCWPGSAEAAEPHPASQLQTAEASFLAENAAAMQKMMAGMDVAPTGDVDADFVAMMVPHHQGAIDMALAVLRYGKNEQIRRLAQEIVITQQQEIVAMRMALGEPPPAAASDPGRCPTSQDSLESSSHSENGALHQ